VLEAGAKDQTIQNKIHRLQSNIMTLWLCMTMHKTILCNHRDRSIKILPGLPLNRKHKWKNVCWS